MSIEEIMKEVEDTVQHGKEVRGLMLGLQGKIHAALELLAESELDLASIIGEGGSKRDTP